MPTGINGLCISALCRPGTYGADLLSLLLPSTPLVPQYCGTYFLYSLMAKYGAIKSPFVEICGGGRGWTCSSVVEGGGGLAQLYVFFICGKNCVFSCKLTFFMLKFFMLKFFMLTFFMLTFFRLKLRKLKFYFFKEVNCRKVSLFICNISFNVLYYIFCV